MTLEARPIQEQGYRRSLRRHVLGPRRNVIRFSEDQEERRREYEDLGRTIAKRQGFDISTKDAIVGILKRTPSRIDRRALLQTYAREIAIELFKYRPDELGAFSENEEKMIGMGSDLVIRTIRRGLSDGK